MQVAAFRDVDEDAIGSFLGTGRVDVQLAHGLHDSGTKKELIFDLDSGLMNQIGSHCFFHAAVGASVSPEFGKACTGVA